ncbi:MAG: hypothetical protein M1836_002827 [Candelina mexicana]|nr:MAG: hypothetical protein M1836_002827 [Candelina mexicana]
MPPPVTPSPHRFINKSKSQRPPNPPSSLQHQQLLPPLSSQQFKPTPRFSVSSGVPKEEPPAAVASSSPLVARIKRPTRDRGHGEIFKPHHENEVVVEEIAEHTLSTLETKHTEAPSHRKRRRLSNDQDLPTLEILTSNDIYISDDNGEPHSSHSASSTDPSPSSPPQLPPLKPPQPSRNRSHLRKPPSSTTFQTSTTLTPRRFLRSTPHSTTQTEPETAPPSRPSFLFPAPNRTDAAEAEHPFPEAFSPHRRGQKFVPGGLAAEVREWVMQTSQTSLHYRRQNEFAVKLRVEEVRRGDGMLLVRGLVNGRETKVILAAGERGGVAGHEGREGDLLGVRAPVWDVEVLGEKWGFGVQWAILGSG